VAGLQARKTEFRQWCRKIVAARLGEVEKRRGHHSTDRVATNVLLSSIAAPVPIKPRHGGYRANIERLTEYVAGCAAPTASIATVVPQHCRLLLAPNARPEGKSALARTPPDPTHAIFSRRQTIFGMFTAASSNIGHVQFALVISRSVCAAVPGRSRS